MKLYLSSFSRPHSFILLILAFILPSPDSVAQCPNLMWSPVTELPTVPVSLGSDPIGCLDRDNKIELFLLGTDGAVWHAAQKDVNSSEWTHWISLGRPAGSSLLKHDTLFPALNLCQDESGLIHLFIAGKGVWEITQSGETSKWSAWHSLGSPPGEAKAVWAGAGSGSGIELFVRTANNGFFHKWQNGGQNWTSNYTAVDWPRTGSPGSILIAKDQRKRIQVITSMAGSIYFMEQQGGPGVFSKWNVLKSPNPFIQFDAFTIGAANNADGRIELIAQSQVNRIWHAWQTPSPKDNTPEWANNWARYNAGLNDSAHIRNLQIVAGANGCLTVFTQYPPDSSGKTQIRYVNQDRPSGDWRGWRYLKDKEFGIQSNGQISLVTGHFGEFHLFIRGQGNSILTATSSR